MNLSDAAPAGATLARCIRLRNQDIARFYRLVPVGTPVRIR